MFLRSLSAIIMLAAISNFGPQLSQGEQTDRGAHLSSWAANQGSSTSQPLTLLTTIEVGGTPDAIVVDHYAGRNDVIFYDRASSTVHFLDGDSLSSLPEVISIPTLDWQGWMAYDHYHHQAYFISTRLQGTSPDTWVEVLAHTIANRSLTSSFSVNQLFNPDPLNPVDWRYGIDGLVFKQPGVEGSYPGRLIIDNTPEGNIDIIDLNNLGSDAARVQRHSYRSPVATTGWENNSGNSLALEYSHQTLPVDDLDTTDILYISDKNHDPDWGLHAVRFNHPLSNLDAIALPDVDANLYCGIGGCQGLAISEARDRLYIASGTQSFNDGFINEVNSTGALPTNWIEMTYGDLYDVLVDSYDPKRVFVAAFDHYYNDPDQALYLHLIYDGVMVDTLQLLTDYDEYSGLRGMVFDPQLRRLYLTVDTRILVVDVDYGSPPAPPPLVTASALILPEGGSLSVPGDTLELDFPAGAVDSSTIVTYTQSTALPDGALYGAHFFDLLAVDASASTPVIQFDPPYTMTVDLENLETGPAIQSTLGIYRWDGSQWNLEPTSTLDSGNQRLSAALDHMSIFAVMGETRQSFLPLVVRQTGLTH